MGLQRSDSTLARLRALLRGRGVAVLALATALGGAALTRLPLFDVPGWELATAMAALLTVLGGAAGVRSARLARAASSAAGSSGGANAGASRPPVALRPAFLVPVALQLLAALVPFAAAVVGALTTTRCSPWAGALFYLLLPVPTALLAAAAGLAAGFATRRAWTAGLLYAGAVAASLAVSLWPLYAGPQVFALNHFFGYFPGPLYDEALAVDRRLLAYRALTLVWTGVVLVGLALVLGRHRRSSRRRSGALAALGLALAAALAAGEVFHGALDLRRSSEDLARALGGRAETAHFVLHYPRSKPKQDVARLERDLEFDYDRVTAFLDAAPAGKIEAWFYRSPDEKQRLVGAAATNFAKPWRREFHVHDEPFPHPVARHEMAHVIAGAFGSPVFRVSARGVVAVNIGLVEGLAVAADDPVDELTLHEWAAAMRRLGLAPEIRGLVDPAGFYRQSASRAYTAAGSFLRFLAERHGSENLRRLYPSGDFRAAFGAPLDALAREWESWLDGLTLSPRALRTAELRFERGSLFQRPCAREVASLYEEATDLREADPDRALGMLERCSAIEPVSATYVRARADLLRAREDFAGARALWEGLLANPGASPATHAQALMDVADIAWEQGDLAGARDRYRRALALGRDRAFDRTLTVKLAALEDASSREPVRRFFAKPTEMPELLALAELAHTPAAANPIVPAAAALPSGEPTGAPGMSVSSSGPQPPPGPSAALDEGFAPIARYLVARQLLQRGAPLAALDWLGEPDALPRALPERELRLEALRMLLKASYLAGDLARLQRAAEALAEQGDLSDRAAAREARDRVAFELRTFGGLIAARR